MLPGFVALFEVLLVLRASFEESGLLSPVPDEEADGSGGVSPRSSRQTIQVFDMMNNS